ncbi:WhiB family transcriptional regulator [Actinomadura rubrisoli]|uniref:Transcriptional regulator WhiB n=1 Tax=Actinomadura rubrisoli TaxID=2530368 RepID=A0A4R5CDS9_9ACTN|nr:WhiB family transcriptional regulator [Actinomadura rubrisoli]TDD97685.1 WhiB family transcriptional regulator [Actinomadura rubrisoli]
MPAPRPRNVRVQLPWESPAPPALPVVDVPAWTERALCAETDPDAFFPEKGESTRAAKRTCFVCEVRTECLEYALAHDERFGVWGGLSERERRKMKRSRLTVSVREAA